MAAMLAVGRGFPDPPSDKPQWLNLARKVFDMMAMRYDDATCGGGLRLQVLSDSVGYDIKTNESRCLCAQRDVCLRFSCAVL